MPVKPAQPPRSHASRDCAPSALAASPVTLSAPREGCLGRLWWRLAHAPYLLLILTTLCWAGNGVLARGVAERIPPVGLAFWRWALAFVLVLPAAASHLRLDWPVARPAWRLLVLLSLLGISCFNTLLYQAMHTTTAVNGALIQSAMPAVIVIYSWLLFRERISRRQVLGLLIAMSGAGLVVLRGDPLNLLGLRLVQGDLLMVVAVFCYGLYSVLLRLRPAIHPLSFVALTFGWGALGLLPLYLWEQARLGPIELNSEWIGSVLYVALFPSVVAFLCWNRGVALVGANRAGFFINLIPIFTALLSMPLLGELPRLYHGCGLLLVFGGMLLFQGRD